MRRAWLDYLERKAEKKRKAAEAAAAKKKKRFGYRRPTIAPSDGTSQSAPPKPLASQTTIKDKPPALKPTQSTPAKPTDNNLAATKAAFANTVTPSLLEKDQLMSM